MSCSRVSSSLKLVGAALCAAWFVSLGRVLIKIRYVRLAPDSGVEADIAEGPDCATSGLAQCSKSPSLQYLGDDHPFSSRLSSLKKRHSVPCAMMLLGDDLISPA